MKNSSLDPIGATIITVFFLLLSYAGYLSYISIDWTVLERLESQTLVLPTPVPASTSATPATPSASISPVPPTKQ